ncbi:MAG: arsenate reductase ArsC [Opitutaceae bacterium]
MSRPSILILCTGNSCRSQMAEGLLRAAAGDIVDVHSAGVKPSGGVHPRAIAAMAEIGIEISGQTSKHLDQFLKQRITTVITVCGNEDDTCPTFPGKVNRHHWGFSDPSHHVGLENEITAEFRKVRDEMKRIFDAYAVGLREGAAFATTKPPVVDG